MGPAPQEKAQEMRQQALREAAKLKILQEEEAQRWIFELIFKPKRKSDLKKVFKASFSRKIMSKSPFFDHFFPRFFVDESWSTSLGVGHPAVKVVCEAARGGECDLEGNAGGLSALFRGGNWPRPLLGCY